MKEKNIRCASYVAALGSVMDVLAARKIDLRKKHIVIVPDRCTLTAERLLCSRFGGAFDVSVTTWSRLLTANAAVANYLPRQGSVMIVRRILEENRARLKCYFRSYRTRGFAAKLYETVSQLAVCGVPPEEVTSESGGAKTEDIRLVYSEYIKRTQGLYSDAAGRMRLLREWLETSDFLLGATVYVACFDAYTKQMRNIMDIIAERADGLFTFDTDAGRYAFGDVLLYAASSPVFAAKAIAARIAYEASRGASYDDMCVVTSDSKPDELKRILGENGVPYTSPASLKLSEHPLGRFLTLSLSLPARGYRAADAVRLSKNCLSGVDKADSDAFERYVDAFGITYKLFLSPFVPPQGADDETLALHDRAERARGIIAEIAELCSGDTPEGCVEKLVDYAEEHYAEALKKEDEGRANPFEKARSLASLCRAFLCGADDRVLLDSLAEGMATTDLASRPALGGAVEIGGEHDFRARSFKYVFVADFDTDKHPSLTPDNGLLSDEDIESMRAAGTEIAPTTAEVNKRAAAEFFLLLAEAQTISLVFTDKPGSCLEFIRSRAQSFVEGGTELDRLTLEESRDARDVRRLCPTRNMLIEQYLSARAQVRESADEPPYYPYARVLVGEEAEKHELPPHPTSVPQTGGLMLGSFTKVSQLETYFSCPMKHWLRYGLRLRRADKGELQPLDVGSLLHEVAEKYVDVMESESPEHAAARLLDDALSRSAKGGLDVNKNAIELLVREATGMCGAIRRQIESGSFRVAATEAEFGFEGSRLPALQIDANGKTIRLRGKIDRVDTCGRLARVVDYKTGSVKFSLTDLKYGVKIQLLVYLAVLIKAGYRPAGAFYFSTLADFGASDPYVPAGVFSNAEDAVNATDPRVLAEGESSVVKVKKRGARIYVGSGESEDDVISLTDYALKASALAAEEIASGYVAPSPFGGSGLDACRACEYMDACGYEGEKRTPMTASLGRKTDGVD